MITIDLQDDDANRTKKVNRSDGINGRQQYQPPLDGAKAKLSDQHTAQSKPGLIARILRIFGNKE
jgi:hypothetical protein